MTSLLSVLLVSSSSSGSKLLFAYPPNAVATPRVQRPLYGKSRAVRDVQARSPTVRERSIGVRAGQSTSDDEDGEQEEEEEEQQEDSGQDMFGSRFIRGESSSSSSSSSSEDEDDYYESGTTAAPGGDSLDYDYVHDEYLTREQRQKETYKVHLGLDTSVLGTLLCPVKELCNKRFEMVVNHLAFIAHPVSKRPRGLKGGDTTAAERPRRRASQAATGGGGPTAASMSMKTLSRTSTFEPTFGSDEEDDGQGIGENRDDEQGQAQDGTPSTLENRRGRRPRDLQTNSTREESIHQSREQQSKMASRPPYHQQSGTASGPSSRRTSHSLPNRPPSLGHAHSANTNTNAASIVNTTSEKGGGGRRSGSSSASSAPPPRFRQMHSSQLQMSSSSVGIGAAGAGAEDGATTSSSASLPPALGAAASSTFVVNASQSVPPPLPSAVTAATSTTSSTFGSSTTAAVPDSAALPPDQIPASATAGGGPTELEESDLNVFSIVLVIDSPPDQHLTYHLGVYYRDVIAPVMAALKSIEKSARYMTRETELIASMREKAVEAGTPLTPHIEELKERSDLCGQLAALYHGVKDSGMAELVFNDDIEMTVILHSELFDTGSSSSTQTSIGLSSTSRPLQGASSSLRRKEHNNAYDQYNLGGSLAKLNNRMTDGVLEGPPLDLDILPWQTLLPLIEPEEMLLSLNTEEEDDLTRFLEIMSPTLTFSEYETLLDTDSDAIIAIAEHLVYFRRAKLIDAISLKCVYVPHRPTRPGYVKLLAIWTQEFASQLPDLPPLPVILGKLSSPSPFEALIPTLGGRGTAGGAGGGTASHLRGLYLDALTWLLRHDLVYQMRLYATLVATPEIKRAAYEREEARQKRFSGGSGSGGAGEARSSSSEKASREGESESENGTQRERQRQERREGGSSGFSERTTSSRTTIAGSMPNPRSLSGVDVGRHGTPESSAAAAAAGLSTTPASTSSSGNNSAGENASSSSFSESRARVGGGGAVDSRSPLPSSYPSSYPYMSAVSASAAARPTPSGLHRHPPRLAQPGAGGLGDLTASRSKEEAATMSGTDGNGGSSKARKIFLSALNAPSIISHPGDPSPEEELWIQEIRLQFSAAASSASSFSLEGSHNARAGGRPGNSSSSLAVFDKILPFLDGSHSLEEILHRSLLTRKALRGVLSDFSNAIVTFLA